MYRKFFIVFSLLSACAYPRPSIDTAVGTKEGVPFVTEPELVSTGLVDEGLRFASKSRYIEAEASLLRADYITPNNDSIRFNLGVVRGMQGRHDEALELLLPLAAKEPQSIQYLSALGGVYSSARRFDEAIDVYKRALTSALKNEDASVAGNITRSLAVTFYAAGREQEALCYSYETMNLKDTPEEYEKNLRYLLTVNAYEAIIRLAEAMEKWHKEWNNRAGAKYYIALGAYASGNQDKAKSALEDATDLQAQAPELQSEIAAAWAVITNAGERVKQKEDSKITKGVEKILEQNKQLAFDVAESPERIARFWPVAALRKLEELKPQLVTVEE